MVSQQLLDYIKNQLALGKSRTDIIPTLLNAGWKQEDIDQAFSSLNSVPSPSPTGAMAGGNGELPPLKQLFQDAWILLKNRFWVMAASGLVLAGGFLIFALISFGIWFGVYKLGNTVSAAIVGAVLGLIALVLYIYLLLWGATATLTAMRDAAENSGVKENLMRARPFIGRIFWVRLLSGLIAAGGFVLLIIPGIIFSIRYIFSSFIAINENQKGRMALAQSHAYIAGRSWKLIGRSLALLGLYLIPYITLQCAIKYSHNTPVAIIAGILLAALQLCFTFYSLTFLYTLYLQFKATATTNEPQKYFRRITGWAIWGIFGTIILIAGIAVISITLYEKSVQERDAQRVKDINQITVALRLYRNDRNSYPASMEELTHGYLESAPQAPTPPDGSCTDEENAYSYTPTKNSQDFELSFCLAKEASPFPSGPITLTAGE